MLTQNKFIWLKLTPSKKKHTKKHTVYLRRNKHTNTTCSNEKKLIISNKTNKQILFISIFCLSRIGFKSRKKKRKYLWSLESPCQNTSLFSPANEFKWVYGLFKIHTFKPWWHFVKQKQSSGVPCVSNYSHRPIANYRLTGNNNKYFSVDLRIFLHDTISKNVVKLFCVSMKISLQ